ncbi:MAG TPA: DUF4340 domain-containing protein [Steroidobacteraceae bacterium]|nr:DUF4340 domain-containing protein [Steroidobacteraceae bacterium]
MSRQRFIALSVAALLAIVSALYLTGRRNPPADAHGAAFLPALAGEMNTVTALSVRRGSAAPTLTLHQQNGRWTVAERADYPADFSKLRKLLLALSDAKIIEQKTSNPANFPLIGVEDPSAPGATGAEISVTAHSGKFAVIIGKPVGEGNFARRSGETLSYSVEPGISFESEPRYWIDSKLIDIAAADIQSIAIKPAAGPAYTLHRTAPAVANAANAAPAAGAAGAAGAPGAAGAAGAANFTLDGVPAGRKAADSALLAPSPTTYGGLTANDVAPVGDIDFSKATVATVSLSDGNVITLTGAAIGDKHWIQLQASKDAALNAKTAGRAFDITGYRYDAIFRSLDALLVPKEPPAGAKKAAPGASPSPSPTKKPKPPAKP